jgi:WD repeat-containing protein 35
VDGNRLWGKELELDLAYVQWSPDGRNILFGTQSAEVHVYDNLGNNISKLGIYAVTQNSGAKIVGLQWYNGAQGYMEPNAPSLAVCFDNGRCQIMRDDTDDNPVLIDTGMTAGNLQWNTMGTVLAISGSKSGTNQSTGNASDTHMVQFYNPAGKHLRTLKVPGRSVQPP